MQVQDQGSAKYGLKDVLASSSGWRGISAEHRHHPTGLISSFQPQHLEVGIATGSHSACVVSRTGDRIRQHTKVEAGTIWFCPAGVLEEDIVLSQWHHCLHIFLPPERFAQLSEERGGAAYRTEAVPYLGGIYHERIRRIGNALLGHANAPKSSGAVLIDSLALELTACIVDNYSVDARRQPENGSDHRLDARRLRRVVDYMTAHLEDDISLDDLAGAAFLSPFHFVRVFGNTMGVPPHRYLSRMRLEQAKTLLALRDKPISQIALTCGFSSQSNFTRAFNRAAGMTPLAFRKQAK